MGSTYSIALYGYDRVKMEAAVDAAFDEVRRLDELLSNYQPGSEWSEVNRNAADQAGQGFDRSFSSFFRPASNTAGRVKVRSISRWDR